MESELRSAASLGSLWHCFKDIQRLFICEVKTMSRQLEGAFRKGQINANMHKRCSERPAEVDYHNVTDYFKGKVFKGLQKTQSYYRSEQVVAGIG